MSDRAAVGAVVLAAGGSSRLGRSKQLVELEGTPLVARAARAALDAGARPVVVVLGADASRVRVALSGLPIVAVVNDAWADGMGTSVAAGMRVLVAGAPASRGVLLALADQPLVGPEALGLLLDAWRSADARAPEGGAIAAAEYAGTVGVPAVFGRAHFDALQALPPGAGANALLRADGARVLRVPMPEASVDVDTPEDLDRLRAMPAAGGSGGRPDEARLPARPPRG